MKLINIHLSGHKILLTRVKLALSRPVCPMTMKNCRAVTVTVIWANVGGWALKC